MATVVVMVVVRVSRVMFVGVGGVEDGVIGFVAEVWSATIKLA